MKRLICLLIVTLSAIIVISAFAREDRQGPTPRVWRDKTSEPTINDDMSRGYRVGDMWIQSGSTIFVCVSATVGSADWTGAMSLDYLVASGVTSTYFYGDGSNLTGIGSIGGVEVISSVSAFAGDEIVKGKAYFIGGSQGNSPKVYKAYCTSGTSEHAIGLAGSSGTTGVANQLIVTQGTLSGVSTAGWVAGDTLYLRTGGNIDNNYPKSGSVRIVGIVIRSHASAGVIFVYQTDSNYIAKSAGDDLDIRMGDSAGANKIVFENYADTSVAWLDSTGLFYASSGVTTPYFGADLTGVTVYQQGAALPTKFIAQGASAGVQHVTFLNSSGTTEFSVDQVGNTYIKGNLGINTATPGYPLDVVGVARASQGLLSGTGYGIGWGTGAEAIYGTNSTHVMSLYTNSLNRMAIDGSGNIGMGAPNPNTNTKLDVQGLGSFTSGVSSPPFTANLSGTTTTQQSASLPTKFVAQGTSAGVQHVSYLDSSGVTEFSVDQAGNTYVKDKLFVGTTTGTQYRTLDFQAATQWAQFKSTLAASYTLFDVVNSANTMRVGVDNSTGGSTFSGTAAYAGTIGTTGNYSMQIATNNAVRVTVDTSGNVGMGTFTPNTNTKLDVIGRGSFTSGVSCQAGVTIYSSGTTPAAIAGAAQLFSAGTAGELWVMDGSGNVTQLSPHDRETGEPYHNSYNVYTGKGEKIWLVSGKRESYTVPRVNPEDEARTLWIEQYKNSTSTLEEVSEAEAFGEVSEEVDDPLTVTSSIKYRIDGDKVVSYLEEKPGKKSVNRKVLKAGHELNSDTGKIYRRTLATKAAAEAAAVTGFSFDWTTLPRFVREAWGK